MASKKDQKQETKTAQDTNLVKLTGTVLRAKQMEKVCRFTLDVATTTAKGNTAHAYAPVVWFNEDTDETVTDGEHVSVYGQLRSGSYEKDGKKVYTLDVVVDKIEFSK